MMDEVERQIKKMQKQVSAINSKRITESQLNLVVAMVSFSEQNWNSFLVIADEYGMSEEDVEETMDELNNL